MGRKSREKQERKKPIILSELDGMRLRVIEGDFAQLQLSTTQIRAQIAEREQVLIGQREKIRQDLRKRYPGFDPARNYLLAPDGVTLSLAPEPPGAARPVLPRVAAPPPPVPPPMAKPKRARK